jgi:hypothetical protein
MRKAKGNPPQFFVLFRPQQMGKIRLGKRKIHIPLEGSL